MIFFRFGGLAALALTLITVASTGGASPGHTPRPVALHASCVELAATLPNVRRELCESAQLVPGAARSVRGRPIWARDIVPAQPGVRVLVIGAIHGDELSSAAVVMRLLQSQASQVLMVVAVMAQMSAAQVQLLVCPMLEVLLVVQV